MDKIDSDAILDFFGGQYDVCCKKKHKKDMNKNLQGVSMSIKTVFVLFGFIAVVTIVQMVLLEPYSNRYKVDPISFESSERGWTSFTDVKSNIAMVTSWPEGLSTEDVKDQETHLLMCHHYNRLAYARYHKYEYGIVSTELSNLKFKIQAKKDDDGESSHHPDWFRIFMLRELLNSPKMQHEWIWYMDNDVVMDQMRISAEDIIQHVPSTASIILRNDADLWDDTRMMLLRNTEFTRIHFLERIWSLRRRYSDCPDCAIHVVLQEIFASEEADVETKVFEVNVDSNGQKCCEPFLQHTPNTPNRECLRHWVTATNAKERNIYPNIQWSKTFPTLNTLYPPPHTHCAQYQIFPLQSFTLLPTERVSVVTEPYRRSHIITPDAQTNQCRLQRYSPP